MGNNYLSNAEKLILEEKWHEASAELLRLLKTTPNDPLLFLYLTKINIRLRNQSAALAFLEQAKTYDLEENHQEDIASYEALIQLEAHIRSLPTNDHTPFPYLERPTETLWSEAVTKRPAEEMLIQHEPRFKVSKTEKVASAGSCFAQHIAKWLIANGYTYLETEAPAAHLSKTQAQDLGYGVYSARYGNIYTPLQLLQLFDRAYGHLVPQTLPWRFKDGFIDPYRSRIQKTPHQTLDAYFEDLDKHLASVRELFETCDVFIFTLGLTETWRSKIDGTVFPVCPGNGRGVFDVNQYEFVNFSAEQTEAHLVEFIEKLKKVNPSAKVLLTVSPVPLVATMENHSVVQSTIVSKSILRVVAAKVRSRFDHVEYFASFEIITNTAAKNYFLRDFRTVSTKGVDHAMHEFAKYFCVHEPPKPTAKTAHSSKQEIEIICDEADAYDLTNNDENIIDKRIWELYWKDEVHLYWPPSIDEDNRNLTDCLQAIPQSTKTEIYRDIKTWLKKVKTVSNQASPIFTFGASHTASCSNWPFRLHTLLQTEAARDFATINFAIAGGNLLIDFKFLKELRSLCSEFSIKPRMLLFMFGANDVLFRTYHMMEFFSRNSDSYLLADEGIFLQETGFSLPTPTQQNSDRVFSKSSFPPDEENPPLHFRLPPTEEIALAKRVSWIAKQTINYLKDWEIEAHLLLQPMLLRNHYPSYEAAIRQRFSRENHIGNENFHSWRRKNFIPLHAGEYPFFRADNSIQNTMEIEGTYLSIEAILKEAENNSSVDNRFTSLTDCFDDEFINIDSPFSTDGYHYTPTGGHRIAETIMEKFSVFHQRG